MMLFWRGWRYTTDVLYCHCLTPSVCGGYLSPLFTVGLVKKRLERGPCIEVGGLSSPLYNILVKGGRLFQKGDTFGHHHHIGNRLPSCMHKLSALLKFFDQSC